MRKPLILTVAALLAAGSARAGGAAGPSPGDPEAFPVWRTTFEKGRRDWSYAGNLATKFVEPGAPTDGMTEAWTISEEKPFQGRFSYKGWIITPKGPSHRAYPCQHLKVEGPVCNSWYVWLDCDYKKMKSGEWIHFATWCNSTWGPGLHTMSVVNRGLEMAHCKWKWVGPSRLRRFPMKQWVRFTYYYNFRPKGDGTIWIWMNGELVFEAEKTHSHQYFERAHWGMYGSGSLDHGVQYNDDIQLWRLSGPWPDKDREPPSPYGPYYDPRLPPAVKIMKPKKPRKPTVYRPKPKPRPRPTAEGLAKFGALLKTRVTEELAAGRRPKFSVAAFQQRFEIVAMDEAGTLRLKGPVMTVDLEWPRLMISDRRSLAVAVLREGTPLDHALAAFYLIADGDERGASDHLDRSGDAGQEEVMGSFTDTPVREVAAGEPAAAVPEGSPRGAVRSDDGPPPAPPAPVGAARPTDSAEARKLFETGESLFIEGEQGKAVEVFRRLVEGHLGGDSARKAQEYLEMLE